MTTHIDLFCILVLAAEWLFFGSCHFAFPEETARQVPEFIPLKSFIVFFTGVVEVVTGFLIHFPKTRKWSAVTSLALLSLFIPSIIYLLTDDTAISSFPISPRVMRAILVPNHVLLVLCAFHLWRSPKSPAKNTVEMLDVVLAGVCKQPVWPGALIVALVMLAANIAGFSVILFSPWPNSTAGLWAMSCLATGALVGFLFGVPKFTRKSNESIKYRPNSNIELVSDWLTKMLVGVGLVEFRNIGGFLSDTSTELGKSLASQVSGFSASEAASFSQALIVYFFVAGMIQGYLLTRMYLSGQFADVETPGRQ